MNINHETQEVTMTIAEFEKLGSPTTKLRPIVTTMDFGFSATFGAFHLTTENEGFTEYLDALISNNPKIQRKYDETIEEVLMNCTDAHFEYMEEAAIMATTVILDDLDIPVPSDLKLKWRE